MTSAALTVALPYAADKPYVFDVDLYDVLGSDPQIQATLALVSRELGALVDGSEIDLDAPLAHLVLHTRFSPEELRRRIAANPALKVLNIQVWDN